MAISPKVPLLPPADADAGLPAMAISEAWQLDFAASPNRYRRQDNGRKIRPTAPLKAGTDRSPRLALQCEIGRELESENEG